ncbi:hypothetical protein GCM10011583_10150 [Streptomyces camponoticapitis]|uniref:Secreted protein n=1 Tax=Streptomyces camponoticapitis TaxID=1616125 RepID=A0ABQ2E1J4_9ACTN|nr:hypothetical protein [Streptomyces camponoticapitis]GGJ80601.1 hypothetical protein GCM10011583_10150 [Streptomyces camponoticapitis]
MRLAEHTVVSAAYALADRTLTRALIPRIREETLALLGSGAPVPPTLLDEVLASLDPEPRGVLLSAARYHGDVFRRLAALGDPASAVHLYGVRDGDRTAAERAAVWEGAAATAARPANTVPRPNRLSTPGPYARKDLTKASGGSGGEGTLPWSTLVGVDEYRLAELLRSGIPSGAFPADRVLREIGPARRVLCGLPHGHEGVRAALGAQVARLGSDFAPWRALFVLLPRFSGSVTELVDAALAEVPKHQGRPWPKPMAPEFPSRRQQGGRAAWLHLYDAADHGTRCALGAHMDLRAIQQLLLWHSPSPELRAHIVRSRGASVLAGIASDWGTPAEVIEELIPYNDPDVNAALFLHTELTPAQRRHILSGRRWQDGRSVDTPTADRLPLTESLVDGVRESARRTWLLACCDSGDPLLYRILLGSPRAKVHTPALELHMLLRLWERHGPGAVRELLDETDFPGRRQQARHPLSPSTVEAGRTALEADGPAPLRAAYERAAGPAGRADFLCDKGAGTERDDLEKAVDLFAEEIGPGPLPWAELEAMHGAKPLHDRILVRLAALDGCPAALAEASALAALRLSHPHYRPRRAGKPPTASEMLAKYPLQLDKGGCRWLEKAHHLGQITLPEVVRSGFPAQVAVAFLSRALVPADTSGTTADADTRTGTEEIREARREVAALAAEHLSDDPEGWALALRLIPEFEGTLPDLLLASGAVVS